MSDYTRFAVYYLPPAGALADFAAAWLGWDLCRARPVAHPQLPGLAAQDLAAITTRPRKYGFHATLKPPFRLAQGATLAELRAETAALAGRVAPLSLPALGPAVLGRFLALVPQGDQRELIAMAGRWVEGLDRFRAPPGVDELARRRAARLSPAQDALLQRWGYPYVMDQFRFHMTLTGRLDPARTAQVLDLVSTHLPPLPQPFVIDQVALVGERADGMFVALHRYALTG